MSGTLVITTNAVDPCGARSQWTPSGTSGASTASLASRREDRVIDARDIGDGHPMSSGHGEAGGLDDVDDPGRSSACRSA